MGSEGRRPTYRVFSSGGSGGSNGGGGAGGSGGGGGGGSGGSGSGKGGLWVAYLALLDRKPVSSWVSACGQSARCPGICCRVVESARALLLVPHLLFH
jgi:hypothetical protein